MKKTAVFLALTIIALSSCTKQNVNPPTGNISQRDVTIEYLITDVSGNVSVNYIAPNASGTLVNTTATIVKASAAITFTSKSNNIFSIDAKNLNPSTQNITVEIYVDGQLFKSGSLDHITLTASASGKVQ